MKKKKKIYIYIYIYNLYDCVNNHQGPVVQSIVSLTKSLVNDSLSLLVCLKSSVLIFFAEKMRGAFTAKAPHIFSAKNGSVFMYNMFEILTSR